MITATELIDALGGNQAVAAIAEVGPSAVSNWRKFGCIPPRLYFRFAEVCERRGIEFNKHIFRETPGASQ